MKQLPYKDFQKLIEAEYEQRDLEFKSPFTWKAKGAMEWIQAKVIVGIIAISNLPLGGRLIIGVQEDGENFHPRGLSKAEFNSFKNYEKIKSQVDGFVYTNSNFNLEYTKNENERYFMVFNIAGIGRYPLITKKALQTGNKCLIEKDILYVRTMSSPYSSVPSTYQEYQEVIDNCVDASIRELQNRSLMPTTGKSDSKLFDEQLGDLI